MNFKEAFFDELEKIAEVNWYLDTDHGRASASGQRYGFFTGRRRGGPPAEFAPSAQALEKIKDIQRKGDSVNIIRDLHSPTDAVLLAIAHRKAHLRAAGYDGKPPVFTREWPLSLKERLKHRLMSEEKRRAAINDYNGKMARFLKSYRNLTGKNIHGIEIHSGK
jgi:hypothetical protein